MYRIQCAKWKWCHKVSVSDWLTEWLTAVIARVVIRNWILETHKRIKGYIKIDIPILLLGIDVIYCIIQFYECEARRMRKS